MMPIPHPRRRVGGGHLRHQMGHVRTGLHRGGSGRRYLPGGAGWWGVSPSLTRTFFGGGRVGQWRSRGSRTPRRWCVTVLVRRTRTSVTTCLRWSTGSPGISLELWSCDGSLSLGVHRPRRYPSGATVLVVLVIIFDDVRTPRDDVLLLIIIECMLIWILYFILWFGFAYFMIWFCLLNAHTG